MALWRHPVAALPAPIVARATLRTDNDPRSSTRTKTTVVSGCCPFVFASAAPKNGGSSRRCTRTGAKAYSGGGCRLTDVGPDLKEGGRHVKGERICRMGENMRWGRQGTGRNCVVVSPPLMERSHVQLVGDLDTYALRCNLFFRVDLLEPWLKDI